jgi:hypothetical protein
MVNIRNTSFPSNASVGDILHRETSDGDIRAPNYVERSWSSEIRIRRSPIVGIPAIVIQDSGTCQGSSLSSDSVQVDHSGCSSPVGCVI